MTTDGISEIMDTYPDLFTEDTVLKNIHKGWLDIFSTYCSNIKFLSNVCKVKIILTDVTGKNNSLKIHFSIKDWSEITSKETKNGIYNIVTCLTQDLIQKSHNIDIKTGEYLGEKMG